MASLIRETFAGQPEEDIKFDEAQTILATGLNNFAQKLHKIVGSVQNNKQNVILSPLSIHSALSMVSAGVKSGSLAEESLMNVLGYTKDVKSKEEFHNAYSNVMSHFKSVTEKSEEIEKKSGGSYERPPVLDFWTMGVIDKIQLKSKFRDTLQGKYNTSMKQVTNKDEANKLATHINKWGQEAGFGGNVVQPDDLIAQNPRDLILMSAVKIQGFWHNSFYEVEQDDLFYNLGDPKRLVKGVSLSRSDVRAKYAIFSKESAHDAYKDPKQADDQLDKLEFRMAEIPLIGDMTFTIIEPLRNGSLDELGKLESALLADGQCGLLDRALAKLALRNEQFNRLQFPKFKFESSIDLKDVFEKMGLELLLTEISDFPMAISKAKHQAVIEVDQNGLKGGAITRIELMTLSLNINRPSLKMIVKNPFLFMIRYKSLSLFMGHVLQV